MTDIAITAAQVASLTLLDLNRQIAETEARLRKAVPVLRRRLLSTHLRWLQIERERLHGVAAPRRKPTEV